MYPPDLIGRKFTRLRVEERGPSSPKGAARWWCRCDCGNPERLLLETGHLNSYSRTSCGCRTAKGAPKPRRRVLGSDGTVYPNLKAASDTFGMPVKTVRRWCLEGRRGWCFVDSDNPPGREDVAVHHLTLRIRELERDISCQERSLSAKREELKRTLRDLVERVLTEADPD